MGLIDNLAKKLGDVRSDAIGTTIEQMCGQIISQRRPHEQRWYNNNFFDDGYHFRIVSRKTGKIIDQVNSNSGYVERAIPRASRQIRGVSNLLFAAEPYPVIYPERITIEKFRDPITGKINEQAYLNEQEKSKQIARKRGIWLSTEWEDEQELPIKLIDMILLAAKNSISYLKVYSEKGKINTLIRDAFDIICYGDRRELKDLPFIIDTQSMDIKEVLTSPLFKPEKVIKLTPDNKYATSEVKEAYMRSRYGVKNPDNKNEGTVMVKEGFLKEYLSDANWKQAIKLGEENGALEGKSKGDMIMRHVFEVGGVTLNDEYIDYDEYPFAELRFEPGMLYQTPFIERFIPQNKSLDVILTRLEKWINAMVVGIYMTRKGENFQLSNFPGGQKIEYDTTPPAQMAIGSIGNTPFNVIELLNKYIEEQGATTSGLGQIPGGVKSGIAIESIKSSEYANLKISTMMLKKTIRTISKLILERADKDFLEPREVSSIEDGEPNYFDVIGKRGYDLSQQINKKLPSDIIVLDKKAKVRIEIEPGLGLTMEGKREAMNVVISKTLEFMTAVPGSIPPEAFQMMIKKFLETFGWGSTQELMEAIENGMTTQQMTEDQITKMKIAMIEAMKDAEVVGQQAEARLVDSTKVGVVEALRDIGMLDGQNKDNSEANKPPSRSISFKDLPPEGKAQMAAQAGINLNPAQIQADELATKEEEMAIKQKEIQLKEKAINNKSKPIA
jgi:hypothetical protein